MDGREQKKKEIMEQKGRFPKEGADSDLTDAECKKLSVTQKNPETRLNDDE